MNKEELAATAHAMMTAGKGLLAMDESIGTCNKRFAPLNIDQTPDMRRAYRELIVTAPNLGDFISGAILADETIKQKLNNGTPFADTLRSAGIIPGIKVDMGAKSLPNFPAEKITEGLDGLPARITEYAKMGARFAKWRAVIAIGRGIPTAACIDANAHVLARYAAICQEQSLVPIVEPEILMDGSHTLQRCMEVTEQVQNAVFAHLRSQRVLLEGMILKPNMVLPGKDAPNQDGVDQVADATVQCLLRTVPPAVPGVAFLSGGQPALLASARLNAMNIQFASRMPWALTFSYSRAIQQPALELWAGHADKVRPAQDALLHRARCNSAARLGRYNAQIEAENK